MISISSSHRLQFGRLEGVFRLTAAIVDHSLHQIHHPAPCTTPDFTHWTLKDRNMNILKCKSVTIGCCFLPIIRLIHTGIGWVSEDDAVLPYWAKCYSCLGMFMFMLILSLLLLNVTTHHPHWAPRPAVSPPVCGINTKYNVRHGAVLQPPSDWHQQHQHDPLLHPLSSWHRSRPPRLQRGRVCVDTLRQTGRPQLRLPSVWGRLRLRLKCLS